MLSYVQIRLLDDVGYRSWDTFCLWDTAINCLGFRVYSHDKDSSCETSAASPDTSRHSQNPWERGKDYRPANFPRKETPHSPDKLRTKLEKCIRRSRSWLTVETANASDDEDTSRERHHGQVRPNKVRISTSRSSSWLQLYYIKVVNWIIKRATSFRVRWLVLRLSVRRLISRTYSRLLPIITGRIGHTYAIFFPPLFFSRSLLERTARPMS